MEPILRALLLDEEPKRRVTVPPEVVCAVTRFAAPTSIGSQNITTPDLNGLTPKAVIFIVTKGITDGAVAAHTQMSFGAATGPDDEWCTSSNSEDAQVTSDSHSEVVNDGCVLLHTPGTDTDSAKADLTEFIADGCTLNWSVVDAAFLITAVFFAGADLSAHANTAALGALVDTATDITDPGFEPDLVIASIANGNAVGENSVHTRQSIGFCSNDGAGGVVQRCVGQTFRDAVGTTQSSTTTRDDSVVAGVGSSGAPNWEGVLSDFDVNGFTCTTASAGGANTDLCYLALSLGGVGSVWVGTHSTPTATGNNVETGPGFTPQLVMRIMTQVSTANSADSAGDQSGAWGVSAMDADDEFAASVADEDAVGTSDSQSLSDDVAIELPDDDGTPGITAAFVSFDANGWTDNYTVVKGDAGLMPALAIQEV